MPHHPTPTSAISFTIDGRAFTVDDKHQSAAALLVMAGLDPAGYDLADPRPGELKKYKDDQQVVVKNGDAFVTVRQSATVA